MTEWIDYGRFQTQNVELLQLLGVAERAAHNQAPVYIHGEIGTGRRTLARWIFDKNPRPGTRFWLWNLNEDIKPQEGDTVLIENIDEAPVTSLVKIRALADEYPNPRVRWIVTSRQEPQRWMETSSLNRDLGYRFCKISLAMPSLQSRADDIRSLADLFLKVCCLVNGIKPKTFAVDALQALEAARWDGNVAELNHVIERALLQSTDSTLTARDLDLRMPLIASDCEMKLAQAGLSLFEMEKRLILQTLDVTRQNKTRAAQMLGISIRTLRNKLNLYREGGGYHVEQSV